ncbi:hypothetical protein J6590_104467, partial [Homalodisca vitripennis]
TGVSVPTEKERHQKAERDTSALAPAQPRCLIGLQRRHLRQIYSPTVHKLSYLCMLARSRE